MLTTATIYQLLDETERIRCPIIAFDNCNVRLKTSGLLFAAVHLYRPISRTENLERVLKYQSDSGFQ